MNARRLRALRKLQSALEKIESDLALLQKEEEDPVLAYALEVTHEYVERAANELATIQ